ncbi:hypothetical protein AABB02_34990 [Streptomyces rimosus]|uniref:hypothetical protein n=1 Tax=Streptomyces rimosus TaxID=1927 RepID=UPI0031E04AA7
MKSWRTRFTVGLAVGAAALTIPLTATTASAGDWKVAGGGRYSSEQACESEARQDYVDSGQYSEVDCVNKGGSFYEIRVR